MNDKPAGRCLCGHVRYAVRGEPVFAAICHCTMCRRASAAPAVAWAMYAQGNFEWLAEAPADYASSPDATRSFCARCGTQIAFRAAYLPELIDVTIGSLDDPEAVRPTLHYWYSKHLSWNASDDALPKHAGFPPLDGA